MTMQNNPYTREARGEAQKLGKGFVFLIVMASIIIIGATTALGFMWFGRSQLSVTINSREMQVARGTTIGALKEELGIEPQAGKLLAIDGSVIDEHGGMAQVVTVNGTEIDGGTADDLEVEDGNVIEVSDGTDTTEEEETREERTPFGTSDSARDSSAYWTGAFHVFGKGQEGVRTIRRGLTSGIEIAEDTAPVVDAGYKIYSAHPDEKVIALTFDDGPWDTTNELLDVLEENDVKATFFVVGKQVYDYEDAVRRAHDMGCDIFTHTWDHAAGSGQGVNLTYMSADEQLEEVTKGYAAIADVLGEEPQHIMRAPGGNLYGSIIDTLWDTVDVEVGWDVDTEDWKRPGTDVIKERILTATSGNIVLMHDGGGDRSQTIAAVRAAIPQLKEEGYRFVTVSELLGYGE